MILNDFIFWKYQKGKEILLEIYFTDNLMSYFHYSLCVWHDDDDDDKQTKNSDMKKKNISKLANKTKIYLSELATLWLVEPLSKSLLKLV